MWCFGVKVVVADPFFLSTLLTSDHKYILSYLLLKHAILTSQIVQTESQQTEKFCEDIRSSWPKQSQTDRSCVLVFTAG